MPMPLVSSCASVRVSKAFRGSPLKGLTVSYSAAASEALFEGLFISFEFLYWYARLDMRFPLIGSGRENDLIPF
jgi:hypothetical protein